MNDNLAYQETRREELIGGEVVMMAPASTNHTFTANNIYRIFGNYLKGKKCVPFGDGLLVHLTDQDKFVPDVMIVCDREKIKPDGVHGAPDLVVEILSPSTGLRDKGRKKNIYESCGVPEYWIVSPEARSIDVYRLEDGRYELDNSYSVYPDYLLSGMTDEEKAAVVTEFKCHLFDDLVIRLDDVFSDLF